MNPIHLFRGCLFVLLSCFGVFAVPRSVHAEPLAYAVADHTTGFVLESANAQKKLQVGSLTKIATAMVVLDWSEAHRRDLSELAVIPDSVASLRETQGVGFAPGDRCSLRDLLYAALMQSDNQAAETLADHVGRALGSSGEGEGVAPVAAFVAQMNALAKRLGMVRTRFLNPHGLDSLERALPYSTAEDLARLTAYAMSSPAFCFYVSQKERKITLQLPSGESSGYLLRNTNELIGTAGIDGVKTGTTRRAGQCLIVSAARPPESRTEGGQVVITPRRLNVVVLGGRERFGEAAQLLARGWRSYEEWAAAGRPSKSSKPAR